jgi:LysR family transcriptional regulator, glycine cleavage system transcriptional activator
MKRIAPPFEAIEAFVIASRCQSFREAAEKLALSASALSRRIQKLEHVVGMPLFDRASDPLRLTAIGARYLREIEPAVTILRPATVRVRSMRRSGTLRVMVSQSLATGWLVRRLPAFYAGGSSEIELHIGRDLQRLRSGDVDLAILGGEIDSRELRTDRLIDLRAAVVSAPQLVDGRPLPASIDELSEHRLLTMRTPPDTWQRWAAEAGHPLTFRCAPTEFESLSLLYEATASGLGVSLGIPIVADALIREGRLRVCFPRCAPIGSGYSLVYADDTVSRRADVKKLKDWLLESFRHSALEFDAHVRAASGPLRSGAPVFDHKARKRLAGTVRVGEIFHPT